MGIKFNCSNAQCRQRIEVEDSMAGRTLVCPGCTTVLHVPDSSSIKFNCTNGECEQHIVVDVSEAGRYVRCPGCGKTLQVPGDPPKSSFTPKPVKAREVSPEADVKVERPPIAPWRRLLMAWGLGLVLFGLVVGGIQLRSWWLLPRHFKTISDELFFGGDIRDAAVVNGDNSIALYARDVNKGVGVFLMTNVMSGKAVQIAWMDTGSVGGQKAFKMIGWSPDQRYLAYTSTKAVKEGGKEKLQELVLCDGKTGERKRAFGVFDLVQEAVWLESGSLVFMDTAHHLMVINPDKENKQLGKSGRNGLVALEQFQDKSIAYSLTADSGSSVVVAFQANLWHYDIPSRKATQMTHFTNALFEWLDYSPENGKYLMCMSQVGGDLARRIFSFDPKEADTNKTLVQLSDEYALKPRWIMGGKGISYVGGVGGSGYLAVHTEDPALQTNLFAQGGSVRSYNVSPDRTKIYAVAATEYRPLSIWAYDIDRKGIWNLVKSEQNRVYSQTSAPEFGLVTNQAGETVYYYYVPPVNLKPGKKYPVFLDQYSINRFDQTVQLLANSGIYYVSANRFGTSVHREVPTKEDTLAVYRSIVKKPNVDPNRIYVSGNSFSTISASELVQEYPELWRGIVMTSPVAFPKVRPDAARFPNVFISVGDEDQSLYQAGSRQLFEEACRHLAPARLDIKHSGHTYTTESRKGAYEEIVKFILEN